MSLSRRTFLTSAGLALAAAATGCAPGQAPAVLRRSERRVLQSFAGMPTTDGAGVRLLRIIGQPALRHLDPFLLLDRFHSDDPDAYIRGFPDHPHRGFETVTIMRAGRMRHADSRGNRGVIEGGGVQWMTAGRGIVHSEMPEQQEGLLSGFQLWVNLPAREKMCAPAYQDLEPGRIARGALGASRIEVAAGAIDGLVGPVEKRPTRPLLAYVSLEDDQPVRLELPEHHTAFVYVAEGEVEVGPGRDQVVEGRLGLLGPGHRLTVRAPSRRTEVLVAAAMPLREPIVQRGPFVMNTEEEIRQAFLDYRAGRLGRD